MAADAKQWLGIDVLTAARDRISWTLDTFPRVYVSFSGGKDSTVMLHLAALEARRLGRKIGVLFIDLEAQYALTIEHVETMYELYRDVIEAHWIALPLNLRNAVSVYEPHWTCWDPDRESDWVRSPHESSVIDPRAYPFFAPGMEFEEFAPRFGWWYAQGQLCACLVGIRTAESLNRWRTIKHRNKTSFEGRGWTTYTGETLYNVYPIYDWQTEDLWTYHARTGLEYNRLYDRMWQAGLTIHQARICQPYGDDQRKGLWLYHLIEPETWARVVARVNGANQGALYARESGNVLGRIKITRPEGHTWESFARLLLRSMPEQTERHYSDKIAVFLNWWYERGYREIPDEADPREEQARNVPSWRRICKVLLRNDYWCKGLSFTPTKSGQDAYDRYKAMMKKRRKRWAHLPI